jgi:hypothetical protein
MFLRAEEDLAAEGVNPAFASERQTEVVELRQCFLSI